jgi:hypothetical protein
MPWCTGVTRSEAPAKFLQTCGASTVSAVGTILQDHHERSGHEDQIRTLDQALRQARAQVRSAIALIERDMSKRYSTDKLKFAARALDDAASEIRFDRAVIDRKRERRGTSATTKRAGHSLDFGRRYAVQFVLNVITGDKSRWLLLGTSVPDDAADNPAKFAGDYVAAMSYVLGIDFGGAWSDIREKYRRTARELLLKPLPEPTSRRTQ